MRIPVPQPLFAWDCLEDSPSLKTIRRFLQAAADGELLEALRRRRGKGRDDYPVHVCWGVILLTIVLRHRDIQACLNELGRNPDRRLRPGGRRQRHAPPARRRGDQGRDREPITLEG